jgi:hypothetical protein
MDDIVGDIEAFFGPNRPPPAPKKKQMAKYKETALPKPEISDPKSLKLLMDRLKENCFGTEDECATFATNILYAVKTLSPEDNAMVKKRFPEFVKALPDGNLISRLSDQLFKPEPIFGILLDLLIVGNNPSELPFRNNISFKAVSSDQLKQVAIVLINCTNFIGRLATEKARKLWKSNAVLRTEIFWGLQQAGLKFTIASFADVVSFLFQSHGSVVTLSDEMRMKYTSIDNVQDIDAKFAAAIGTTVKKAKYLYSIHFDRRLDLLPFSKEQEKVLVAATVLDERSHLKLAGLINHAKSPDGIYHHMNSNEFKVLYNSLSSDEILEAVKSYDPSMDEAVIKAKIVEHKQVCHSIIVFHSHQN